MIDTERRFVLWLLGPTSSGKSTVAESLVWRIRERNTPIVHYDGDEVRELLGPEHGFSSKDRLRVVKSLAYLSNKASGSGLNVVVSALTANSDARRYIVENVKGIIIGYVRCSVEICAQRDPKGLYKKARQGEIATLIGFNSEYTTPANPDIVLDTEQNSLETIVGLIEEYLEQLGYSV